MAAEPALPEPVLRNGRGHDSERPAYRKKKKKITSSEAVGCVTAPGQEPQLGTAISDPAQSCWVTLGKSSSARWNLAYLIAMIYVSVWHCFADVAEGSRVLWGQPPNSSQAALRMPGQESRGSKRAVAKERGERRRQAEQ